MGKNKIIKGRRPDKYRDKKLSLLNYNFSDAGNAERLVTFYGSDIRFSFSENRFYIWNGKYWRMDTTREIFHMAKNTLRWLKEEGEEIDETSDKADKNIKNKAISFAIKSESDSRIKAMVNLAKCHPEIVQSDWDKNPYLLNVSNGTLDLRTGKLRDHRRQDYITRLIDIRYDEGSKCPNWMSFLNKIFMKDGEIIDFVQRSIGYSITDSQEEQCFYMLYGNGANGKTTFLNAIKAIMGNYADTLRASSLMARQYESMVRGDMAKLVGKRFVVSSELNEGQNFDESLIKCITGGEAIPVRYLYGKEFEFKPKFKIWMGTNEKPKVRGSDYGIWRRVRLIPFLYTFSEDERDKNYFNKFILPELPAYWPGRLKAQSCGRGMA